MANEDKIVRVSTPRGPKVDGRYPLTQKNRAQKEVILKDIQKAWKVIMRQHFDKQARITDGKAAPWQPLSERYLKFKKRKGLIPLIMRMNRPSLSSRYQNAIKYNTRDFRIYVTFPDLIGAPRITPNPATAAVHQKRNKGNTLGRPLRRIILKDFKAASRRITLEHLTKR